MAAVVFAYELGPFIAEERFTADYIRPVEQISFYVVAALFNGK